MIHVSAASKTQTRYRKGGDQASTTFPSLLLWTNPIRPFHSLGHRDEQSLHIIAILDHIFLLDHINQTLGTEISHFLSLK